MVHSVDTKGTRMPAWWACDSDVRYVLKYQVELPTFFKLVLNNCE